MAQKSLRKGVPNKVASECIFPSVHSPRPPIEKCPCGRAFRYVMVLFTIYGLAGKLLSCCYNYHLSICLYFWGFLCLLIHLSSSSSISPGHVPMSELPSYISCECATLCSLFPPSYIYLCLKQENSINVTDMNLNRI